MIWMKDKLLFRSAIKIHSHDTNRLSPTKNKLTNKEEGKCTLPHLGDRPKNDRNEKNQSIHEHKVGKMMRHSLE